MKVYEESFFDSRNNQFSKENKAWMNLAKKEKRSFVSSCTWNSLPFPTPGKREIFLLSS